MKLSMLVLILLALALPLRGAGDTFTAKVQPLGSFDRTAGATLTIRVKAYTQDSDLVDMAKAYQAKGSKGLLKYFKHHNLGEVINSGQDFGMEIVMAKSSTDASGQTVDVVGVACEWVLVTRLRHYSKLQYAFLRLRLGRHDGEFYPAADVVCDQQRGCHVEVPHQLVYPLAFVEKQGRR